MVRTVVSPATAVDHNRQLGTQFVSLSTAAYYVYREVMATEIRAGEVAQLNAALEEVAHALASVASIYSLNRDAGTYKQLEPVDLMFGVFQRGATVLWT